MTNATYQKDYKELGNTHGYEEYREICELPECTDYSSMLSCTGDMHSSAVDCWDREGDGIKWSESEEADKYIDGYKSGARKAIEEAMN